MTSSIKPEVHEVDLSQRCQRTTDPRATTIDNMYKHLVQIGRVVPKICSRTDRRAHHNTSSPPLPGSEFGSAGGEGLRVLLLLGFVVCLCV